LKNNLLNSLQFIHFIFIYCLIPGQLILGNVKMLDGFSVTQIGVFIIFFLIKSPFLLVLSQESILKLFLFQEEKVHLNHCSFSFQVIDMCFYWFELKMFGLFFLHYHHHHRCRHHHRHHYRHCHFHLFDLSSY